MKKLIKFVIKTVIVAGLVVLVIYACTHWTNVVSTAQAVTASAKNLLK